MAKTKITAKKTVKKTVSKPAAKKTTAKAPAKKTTVKKTTTSKTPVAKKTTAKKTVKKATPKVTTKKTVAKKVAVKTTAKKTTTKAPAKKTTTKQVVAKKATTKAPVKKTVKDVKSTKETARMKKIQEYIKEHSPEQEDDNYTNYKLPIIGRTRYSDVELGEFKTLINKKIAEAREELNFYQDQMKESEMNDDDIKFSGMEDGGHTNDKEHLSTMANRQVKFIQNLESALIRIENKTYGICRATGDLIDKKRLMAVPHATLSVAAKLGKKG